MPTDKNQIAATSTGRYLGIVAWLLLLIVRVGPLQAQKYNFIQYSVENGLVQSQPTCFAQNANHELFIGTIGGISRFDGDHFTNYNKANGLTHNVIRALAFDRRHHLWIATPNGVSRFDGRRFENFLFARTGAGTSLTTELVVDGNNRVWVTHEARLFFLKDDHFVAVPEFDTVLAMTISNTGNVWIYDYPHGVYTWNGSEWHQALSTAGRPDLAIYQMSFGPRSGELYAIGSRGVMVAEKGHLTRPDWLDGLPSDIVIHYFLEDRSGTRWLAGSDGGVWALRKQGWIHYTFENGFSNEQVNRIFEDVEGNIWLATNGSGMFRYTDNAFTYFDRSSGLSSPAILSITQTKRGDMLLAGSGNSYFRMHDGDITRFQLPDYMAGVNTLLTDRKGQVWAGTDRVGVFRLEDGRWRRMAASPGMQPIGVVHLSQGDSCIWVAAMNGLFRGDEQKVQGSTITFPVYTVYQLNTDTLLLGTISGAYLYHISRQMLEPTPLVADASVFCFASDDRYVYVGTDDRGIVIWDQEQKTFTVLNQKNGLSCNYIYSLLRDRNNHIWAGSGCGIDEITPGSSGFSIRRFESSDGLRGLENNSNASFEDRSGYLWFGTTKGLFKYDPFAAASIKSPSPPVVMLQSLQLFAKPLPPGLLRDSLLPFSNLPYHPVFAPNQNNLSFTFKGICLASPDKIIYRYQLVGIDETYTESHQNSVVYPNLPSGNYVLKVWASDADGNFHANALEYPFTINTPYYQTLYFQLGVGMLLVALILGGVYWQNRRKAARRRWEHKLREEEQARVRQKTAEDFHDEIGNKLTRINLLASIAERKLKNEPNDLPSILQQIQQNVAALYAGTKDIIWSLQPESDYLNEIINRIRQQTAAMLEGSDIGFEFKEEGRVPQRLKVPPDYSRNLIMIFKEAMNNIVKHAHARKVSMHVRRERDSLVVTLADDGIGIADDENRTGNGLWNMQNRARRIQGTLTIGRPAGGGTELTLVFPLSGWG